MEKVEIINDAFKRLRFSGIAKSQREFARLLGVNEATISKALKGEDGYLSDIMMSKVNALMIAQFGEVPDWGSKEIAIVEDRVVTLPVIPTEAMAGTLGEFSEQVKEYDCEKMISPIKGADYAMKVCGDSMSPEYPSGCQILIKRVNEKAFVEWGKVYVLDTENGAVIKQIRKTDRENEVECVSLNPTYQPFTIDTSYIKGWYRVLMVLALK